MYTAAKRRVREAEKRVERLHYKFINEYVKNLHHNIYKDAENLYNTIRQKYPDGVKDLTKTVEFMAVATPDKTVPRYYMSRKTTGTTTEMEMVLRIPLIQHDGENTGTQAVTSPPSPQDVALPVLPEKVYVAVTSPPSPQDVALPVLPEKVYQDLLQELQKDSDLMEILNNFPLDDEFSGNDTTMDVNDICESIMPDDMSPLEDELRNVFMC